MSKKQQTPEPLIFITDIVAGYNILYSIKDISIKNARFSHELSMLRTQMKPITESYQEEIQKVYNTYGKNVEAGKWTIPTEVYSTVSKEVESLNNATHSINKVKGISKDYIFEIPGLEIPSTFWDLVYDKFFNES